MKRLIRKIAAWIGTPQEIFKDEGPQGWFNPKAQTCKELGEMEVSFLKSLPGYNNENHQWEDWTSPEGVTYKYFGNYREDKWNAFLEDIKVNGMKTPITLTVEHDGTILVYEGNHRIAAAEQLGLTSVPVEVYYMGNAQREHRIT